MKTNKEQFNHVKKRAFERYQFDLTFEDERLISQLIRDNPGTYFFKKIGRRRNMYKVPYKGFEFVVIYSKTRNRLITML